MDKTKLAKFLKQFLVTVSITMTIIFTVMLLFGVLSTVRAEESPQNTVCKYEL